MAAKDGLEHERKLRRAQENTRQLKSQLNAAVKEIERLEGEKDLLLGLSERKNVRAWGRDVKITQGRAVATYVISDLHFGETVRKEQVLGWNEYNLKIAEKRMKNVAYRGLDLLKKERVLADIDECLVYLGGDLIGGHIHPELAETSEVGIATCVEFAEDVLERLLRTLWNGGKFRQMTVVCLAGNHGRTTPKVQHSSFMENSFETIVYTHLRRRFSDNRAVRWIIAEGEYVDVPVYDWRIRMSHGHRVKFGGGVGGLTIPWAKHVMRLNRGCHADFTIGGHLHTWTYNPECGFLVNGSLIGDTPYSLPYGHQEPCQGFMVIDKKRLVTAATQIYVD